MKQATQVVFNFEKINRASGAIDRAEESGKVNAETDDNKIVTPSQYELLKNVEKLAAFSRDARKTNS